MHGSVYNMTNTHSLHIYFLVIKLVHQRLVMSSSIIQNCVNEQFRFSCIFCCVFLHVVGTRSFSKYLNTEDQFLLFYIKTGLQSSCSFLLGYIHDLLDSHKHNIVYNRHFIRHIELWAATSVRSTIPSLRKSSLNPEVPVGSHCNYRHHFQL